MKILNCSKNKILSINSAILNMHGKKDTILNHIKNSHITIPTKENNNVKEDCFYVHGVKIDISEIDLYIKLIWVKYFLNNKQSQNIIKNYDIFAHENYEPFLKYKEEAILIYKENKIRKLLDNSQSLIKLIERNGYYFKDLNFLNKKNSIFLNSVGCYGEMDNVFSKIIKRNFPNVFKKYYLYCKQSNFERNSIGKITSSNIVNNNKIINLFITDRDILAIEIYQVENVFIKLKKYLNFNNLNENTVYVPYKFGINITNEIWEDIYKMINSYIENIEIIK